VTSHPSVDVIIAARNEARLLGATLQALRDQDYGGPRQVYVVDDGSTDATADVARAQGVQVVRGGGRGAAAARNVGLRAGGGELVAFLDAHSVAASDWLRLMVAALREPRVGGCQSWIDSRSLDTRVQRYLDASGALENERVLDDSLRGARNLYPWILTCNCLYRRAAVEEVGGFNEAMLACEDVELAWRVVLCGFQLAYVPAARLTHYDASPWRHFVRKGFRYGRGAAQLARCYRPHGARRGPRAEPLWRRPAEAVLASLHYRAGFRWEQLRQQIGAAPLLVPVPVTAVREAFRPWIEWSAGERVRISPHAVYWLGDAAPTSVVIHPASHSRYELSGTADFIWRRLASERPRAAIVADIVATYGVATVTAGADLDEWLQELTAAALVERAETRQSVPLCE
jgi:GT2 family glycosyltransferase